MSDGKACSSCGRHKPMDDYYVDKRSGRPYGSCKACHNLKTSAWRKEHKDRVREINRDASRKYWQRHPELSADRYWKDPELARAKMREWSSTDNGKRSRAEKAKRARDQINDSYAKRLVIGRSGLSADAIPPELVLAKREQLLMVRLQRQLQVEIKAQLEMKNGN